MRSLPACYAASGLTDGDYSGRSLCSCIRSESTLCRRPFSRARAPSLPRATSSPIATCGDPCVRYRSSWIAMTTCARSLPSHPGCLPAATTSTIRHVRVIRIPRARLQVRLRSPYTFALELCVQRVGCRQLCLGGSDQEGRSDRHQRVKHCVRVLICVTSQTDAGSVMAPASDPTRVPMRVRSPLGTRLCLNRVQMIRSWTSRWRRPLRAMVSRPLRILSLNSLYQDGTSST
jgi:hypothetical protein